MKKTVERSASSSLKQTNVAWLSLFLMLFALGGFLIYHLFEEYEGAESLEKNHLSSEIKRLDTLLSTQILLTDLKIKSILAYLDHHKKEEKLNPTEIGDFAQRWVAPEQGVLGFVVVKPEGTIFASNFQHFQGEDVRHRDYFRNPLAIGNAKKLYISKPFMSKLGVEVIAYSKISFLKTGEPEWIVTALVEKKYFYNIFESARYAEDMQLRLGHLEGETLLELKSRVPSPQTGLLQFKQLNRVPSLEMDKFFVLSASRQEDKIFEEFFHEAAYQVIFYFIFFVLVLIVGARWIHRQQKMNWLTRRHEFIINSAAEGIYCTDKEGRITFINDAGARLLGYTKEEMMNKPSHALLHHTRPDGTPYPVEECPIFFTQLDGQSRRVSDDIFIHREGHAISVEFIASPLLDLLEQQGTVIVFRDISARLSTEKALLDARNLAEEANRAKSLFLANMSHEIRTPMNAILGLAQLTLKTPLQAIQRDYVEKLEHAGRSLLAILNDILDFSKVEAGKIEIEHKAFNLHAFLDQIEPMLTASHQNHPQVRLHYERSRDLVRWVEGDPLRLQQVLINLAGNALKFTQTGFVKVHIEQRHVEEDEVQIRFSIQDSGIGIDPAHFMRIFSGFSQAETSITRRFGGTGLGLAISSRLVELMGGHLVVCSALGQGSEFSFSLCFPRAYPTTTPLELPEPIQHLAPVNAPAAVPEEAVIPSPPPVPAAVVPEKTPQKGRLAGLSLLLVEDNRINQLVATEMLKAEGARITVAENGRLALDILLQSDIEFQCVLMDIQMPVMDGFQATREIRETLGLHRLPIIAMTANAMASDREASLAVGMNEHIGKPFDLDKLVALILSFVPQQPAVMDSSDPDLPEEPPSLFPVVAGFAFEEALHRLGGYTDLYLQSLEQYAEEYPATVEKIQTALKEEKLTEAIRFAHSLKGVSATLGVTIVSEQAKSVELLLKAEGATAPALNTYLRVLAQSLKETALILNCFLKKSEYADKKESLEKPTECRIQLEANRLKTSLHHLIEQLEENDLSALETLSSLSDLKDSPHQAIWEALSSAVEHLDFPRAQQEARALLHSLEKVD